MDNNFKYLASHGAQLPCLWFLGGFCCVSQVECRALSEAAAALLWCSGGSADSPLTLTSASLTEMTTALCQRDTHHICMKTKVVQIAYNAMEILTSLFYQPLHHSGWRFCSFAVLGHYVLGLYNCQIQL